MTVTHTVLQRVRGEVQLAGLAGRDWRAYIAPLILIPLAVIYWITPRDLIPDDTPYIGRLDDIGVIIASLAGSRAGFRYVADSHLAANPHQSRLRAAMLAAAGWLVGKPLFRLSLGCWPSRAELRLFRAGIARSGLPVPPLLRGLAAVPRARTQLRHLLQLATIDAAGDSSALVPLTAPAIRVIQPHSGDPLRVWTGPPIAFMHVEKAAGTAFLQVLAAQFHPGQIHPDGLRSMPPHLISRFMRGALDDVKRYSLVWGHYDLPSLKRLGDDRLIYTLLREPRARVLSLYAYWRAVDPAIVAREHGNHTVRLAQAGDLLDFLRHDDPMLRDYIDNVYVRRLTGRYLTGAEAGPSLAQSGALEEALAALAALPCLGISEQLDMSLSDLARTLGVNLPQHAPRANVTADNARFDPRFRAVPPEPLTPAIEAELDRLTCLDQVIYDTACATVAKRRGW